MPRAAALRARPRFCRSVVRADDPQCLSRARAAGASAMMSCAIERIDGLELSVASLSQVRVPSDAAPTLDRLSRLSASDHNKLTAVLHQTVSNPRAMRIGILAAVPDLAEEEAADLVGNLLALSALSASHGFEPGQLAAVVCDLVSEELEDPLPEGFPTQLAGLISAQGVAALAKAIDVSREFERLIHLSRVITDIRPVFDADPTRGPLGSVLVHTLRLDFYAEGKLQSLSFALESDDIRQMIETLERAEAKAVSLGELLDGTGIARFDLGGDANE